MSKPVFVARLYKNAHNQFYARYICRCGEDFIVLEYNAARKDRNTTCGCVKRDQMRLINQRRRYSDLKRAKNGKYINRVDKG